MYAPFVFGLCGKRLSPLRLVVLDMLCYMYASVIVLCNANLLAFGSWWEWVGHSVLGGTFILNAIQSKLLKA